jgi:hypothetical protein
MAFSKYTVVTLQKELKDRGKNLGETTIKKFLDTGKFGPVEHTGGRSCRHFYLRADAVDNFLKAYARPEPAEDVKKIVVKMYSQDGAREMARNKVEDDIKRGAPWVKDAEALGTEGYTLEIENMIERYSSILLEKYIEVPDVSIEDIQEIIKLPQDTLSYAETRYEGAVRDYFISRYIGYFKHNDSLNMLNPINDAIIRFVIDDEIIINELRTKITLSTGNAKEDVATRAVIHETLSQVTNRWLSNIKTIGLSAKPGQNVPAKEPSKTEDEDKPSGPELVVSAQQAQDNANKIR